jgi:Xaa-Pro aminopeptidase/CheY-like chemotaxis protein
VIDPRFVAILADDLIWATRLDRLVRDAGARPTGLRSLEALDATLAAPTPPAGVVVDLTSRTYPGLEAVRRATAAGVPVVAVGQHDDREGRAAARAAGASDVYAYGRLFASGPRVLGAWVRGLPGQASARGKPDTVVEWGAGPDGSGVEGVGPDRGGQTASGANRPLPGPVPAVAGTGPAAGGIAGSRPAIPPERYAGRIDAARDALASAGTAALLVGVGADLRWLTGYDAMNLERLTMLVLPRDGDPTLIVPRLEAPRASRAPAAAAGIVRMVTWEETEDPVGLVPGLVPTSKARGRLLVSDRLWASFVLRLQAAFPAVPFGLASDVLRRLRMAKDADEIALLRAAAHAADRVVLAIAAGRLVGRPEMDVGREVRERLLDEGHEIAAFAIVGSGPNSASPHHEASPRRIGAGEPVVLDIGGAYEGYGSDTTRTLWVTGTDDARPDVEFERLYEVLQAAQAAATAAVRPGTPAERIDEVGRGVIERGGLGAHFIHRIGHGIGLEEHEDPYLVAGNAEPLEAGYAFSIEPGIYIDGRYGARIEDIVVCGPDGPDVLNETTRDLLRVRGV